jgi:hypothetical protein
VQFPRLTAGSGDRGAASTTRRAPVLRPVTCGDAPLVATDQTASAHLLAPYAGESGNLGAGSGGGSDDRSDRVPYMWHTAA